MDSLLQYLSQDFKSSPEIWEKLLKSELKLEEVTSKTSKKTLEGPWPTLTAATKQTHLLSVKEKWKKAAQSYVLIPTNIKALLQDDLSHGVRLFFFDTSFLKQNQWNEIEAELNAFPKKEELQVFLLGEGFITNKAQFSMVQEDALISGRMVHAAGGNNIQELGQLTVNLINQAQSSKAHTLYIALFIDSHIFKNIAKIRAAKLLTQKVLEVAGLKKEVRFLALTSFREWTLYERYSNMLRNVAAVAAGYMAGADFVQSSGYQNLLEMEFALEESEHSERSYRMARNSSHILALESMLGVVEDPAFGSFHLEALTESYASKAWELMQKVQHHSEKEIHDYFLKEAAHVRSERDHRIQTRRHVLAGMNDFPDVKEVLGVKQIPVPRFYRVSLAFEQLRLTMEEVKKKPEVYIGVYGDYGALNARINFVKNYFELLGLNVIDPGHSQTDFESFKKEVSGRPEKIVVLCMKDDDYPLLHSINIHAKEKFIAGKFEKVGFQNLYAGQNVYELLSGLVERWSRS